MEVLCNICQRDLHPSQFGHGRKSTSCQQCRQTHKKCSVCNEVKPREQFGSTGRHGVCRACRSAKANHNYHTDRRARALQIARSMNASMLKRTRGRDSQTVDVEALVALVLSASACAYCGGNLQKFGLAVDHKLALSQGGSHSLENLVIACKPCNRAKGDLSVVEFLEWLAVLRNSGGPV